MKISICIVFMLLFVNQSFSQKSNKALNGSYTTEELDLIKKDNPEAIDVLIYGIKNATFILDVPKGKEVQIDGELSLPEGKFSYVDLGLKIIDRNQYFNITGSDKLLVVKSSLLLEHELKNNSKK